MWRRWKTRSFTSSNNPAAEHMQTCSFVQPDDREQTSSTQADVERKSNRPTPSNRRPVGTIATRPNFRRHGQIRYGCMLPVIPGRTTRPSILRVLYGSGDGHPSRCASFHHRSTETAQRHCGHRLPASGGTVAKRAHVKMVWPSSSAQPPRAVHPLQRIGNNHIFRTRAAKNRVMRGLSKTSRSRDVSV